MQGETAMNKRRRLVFRGMWAVFLFCWLGGVAFAQQGIYVYDHLNESLKPQWTPDEIIVKFKPGVAKTKIDQINLGHKTAVLFKGPHEKFHRLRVPVGKTVEEMLESYRKNPNVEYAEPDVTVYALFQPNDPLFPYQWHLDNNTTGGIKMKAAWDIQKGNPNVIVAVIDTGIAYELYGKFRKAPDFANTTFVPGYNFVNNTTHANDDNSHGTHVAGTIAQSTNNTLGAAGVAFNAALMPVKVLDKNGSGSATNVANGIYFAADHGAKVINLSLGSSQPSLTIKNALAYAYNKGVTIVCAAGNEFNSGNPPSYPAAHDEYCIAVGATRFDETRSYYSNTGSYLDIAAPGGDTSVNQNGDGYADGILQQTFNPNTKNPADFNYWFFQGTSMATPHVAGVAALLISKGITGPDNVRAALQSTAKDKGPSGWDPEYGAGIVNALAALQYSPAPVHDVAVTDLNPPSVIVQGETVSVVVSVANQGTTPESFGVGLNDQTDGMLLGGQQVTLPAGGTANLTFPWDTSLSSLGDHQLSAEADMVSEETDLADNVMTETAAVREPAHDVAVTAVDAPSKATLGKTASIAVTIENQGTFTETTTVSLDDQTSGVSIGSQSVTINAGDASIVNFSWDTTGSSLGDHDLNAVTSVVGGEVETSDNASQVIVTVVEAPKLHVSNITMSLLTRSFFYKRAAATITIVDASNVPVQGATVSGVWSGATTDSDTKMTDINGRVTVESNEVRNPPKGTKYTFTVQNVSKTGFTYDPASNVKTSNSISVP